MIRVDMRPDAQYPLPLRAQAAGFGHDIEKVGGVRVEVGIRSQRTIDQRFAAVQLIEKAGVLRPEYIDHTSQVAPPDIGRGSEIEGPGTDQDLGQHEVRSGDAEPVVNAFPARHTCLTGQSAADIGEAVNPGGRPVAAEEQRSKVAREEELHSHARPVGTDHGSAPRGVARKAAVQDRRRMRIRRATEQGRDTRRRQTKAQSAQSYVPDQAVADYQIRIQGLQLAVDRAVGAAPQEGGEMALLRQTPPPSELRVQLLA